MHSPSSYGQYGSGELTLDGVNANRTVLAGDHQQLPPFSATDDPPDSGYGLSLFEHLYR